MDFSEALVHLKAGQRLKRSNWNAGGQFIYYVPANQYPPTTPIGEELASVDTGLVPYGAYLAIKTVQGNVVPWLASQTDMLAEDWDFYE